MKLVLFLGSGVSYESGLPLVDELTTRLFSRSYRRDETGRFHPDDGGAAQSDGQDEIAQIRGLLQLLKEHDELDRSRVGLSNVGSRYAATGPIYRQKTTYEDLFALCELINQWMLGLSDNSATTPFLDLIATKAARLVGDTTGNASTVAIGKLAYTTRVFIEAVVADALIAPTIKGLDLVVELARSPDIGQLNIVTLNHDTLVERLLANAGIRVVDGFGDEDGDVR